MKYKFHEMQVGDVRQYEGAGGVIANAARVYAYTHGWKVRITQTAEGATVERLADDYVRPKAVKQHKKGGVPLEVYKFGRKVLWGFEDLEPGERLILDGTHGEAIMRAVREFRKATGTEVYARAKRRADSPIYIETVMVYRLK